MPSYFLSDFKSIRPQFESKQEDIQSWFIRSQAQATGVAASELEEKWNKVACKTPLIRKRGHVLRDYLQNDWKKMDLFDIELHKAGALLSQRNAHFQRSVTEVFRKFYEGKEAPSELIHVSCTGYLAPSGAQILVAEKRWPTVVTHAYHMGCYGSIPAIRMGGRSALENARVDVVHTELCSLHSNLSNVAAGQIVAQSLFADGFIKYSVMRDEGELKVLALHEELLPDCKDAMTWDISEWGFEIFLDKGIPVYIRRALPTFLENLRAKAEFGEKPIFAIHPGGPKVLDQIQALLGLEDEQIAYSREVLRDYGNMSSATLPHIWKKILEQGEKKSVVSLAFGPGLVICGAVMEVV